MLVLVTYDVALGTAEDQRRLRSIARQCQNFGQRVQYSVFECLVDPAQWVKLRDSLMKLMDPERDSLRFYFLGKNWHRRVEHVGAKRAYDPEGPIVV